MNDNTLDRGRHPVNVGHLVMGLAFAGVLGVWALIEGDVVGDDARWLFGVPWVFAGAVGLLVVALGGTRRGQAPGPAYDQLPQDSPRHDPSLQDPRHDQPADEPADVPADEATDEIEETR